MNPSLLAKKEFESSDKKLDHYKKILEALQTLGEGHAKAIAKSCGLGYHQVSRRMKELENLGKVIVDRIEKTKEYKTKVSIYKLTY